MACWRLKTLAVALLFVCAAWPCLADEKTGRLDLYFIDVEGGASTLIVTPAGESLLIDSGYPDNGGRDRDRILKVLRDVAGRKQLDHASVSHWHSDHYGNHAALATQIRIANFYDRGIPEIPAGDARFGEQISDYRAATQNKSQTLKVGDLLPLKSGQTPLTIKVVTSSGDVLPGAGAPPTPTRTSTSRSPKTPATTPRASAVCFRSASFAFSPAAI